MASTYDELDARLRAAFDALAPGADPTLRPSEHADYQANGVMALARALERRPREVAEEVVARLDLAGLAAVEVAGPGFLNLTLTPEYLSRRVLALLEDPRGGIERDAEPRRVVIDYSAPNVAKEMHVGHLRSTVIGDALVRLHRLVGHEVIARNHVGDWGTPFGMLIEHLLDLGEDRAIAELSIGDLNAFYQGARTSFEASEEFRERSRARVVMLQRGDPETRRLWRILVEQSVAYFSEVYAKLDVLLSPADVWGESAYNDDLEGVVADLAELGLLVESDGAQCVFPPGFVGRDGEPLPLIVRKSDGGFGYAATDLAALRDRVVGLGADEILYVVGAPQAQHFAMIFAAGREAGWLPERVRCEHVAFGNVLGPDRKMFKTRSGETVKLVALIDEATERAEAGLIERGAQLTPDARRELASQIARAAIKYADLATERQRDYVFDLDRMLAFEGDTGPYLQYAHARLRSILRRAGEWTPPTQLALAAPEERRLALALLALPEVIASSLEGSAPHRLCAHLHEFAQRLSAFYEACPVLSAEGAVRAERLTLCRLSASALETGLGALGIDAPERL